MAGFDVLIVGAGAAGLMCAANAAYRGRKVCIIDHANKAGKKILMSGGGRCNFTNTNIAAKNFISQNPYFCISALKRYTPQDFIDLVDRHSLDYIEKKPGQLFCKQSAKDLLNILLVECGWAGVCIRLNIVIESIIDAGTHKKVMTNQGAFICESLVIATGGLSIPTMGATGFGYQVAKQFSIPVINTRAALVPITLQADLKEKLQLLTGLSCDVTVSCSNSLSDNIQFHDPMLFTHRGLSGPAILQISSFWQPGNELYIDLSPTVPMLPFLLKARSASPKLSIEKVLSQLLPKRFASLLVKEYEWQYTLAECSNKKLEGIARQIHCWSIKPNGTEGYRTAEVTLGGVDTQAISSKTFAAHNLIGLYFIGEVLDVTGMLGGYNFQWAWSSGYCAAQYV